MSEHNKSDSSNEFEAIPPGEYDMMLTDINEEGLKKIGDKAGIVNLSPATFLSQPFPVQGIVYGLNNRLMVCLICRRVKKPAATVNVWFLVDTGSNPTYLSKRTIEALIGSDNPFPSCIDIAIQDPNSVIECDLSPPDKHFPDANVLGMNAMRKLKIWMESMDWDKDSWQLVKRQLFSPVSCMSDLLG